MISLKGERLVLCGGTTLVDDVDGLADMVTQLKAGSPPRSTSKQSNLRRLALKRTEYWCMVEKNATHTDMILAPGSQPKDPLFGNQALHHLLETTEKAVNAKEAVDGPTFMKPFKTWK